MTTLVGSISATSICDSISNDGVRLLTIQYVAPRSILAEINTHGMLSKNARSSRAVPTKKLIEELKSNPYIPTFNGKNKPGMQAGDSINEANRTELIASWLKMRDFTINEVETMLATGNPHKQDINRALEPWMWVDGIITATNWANFFALRDHEDAHPDFRTLAQCIIKEYSISQPKPLRRYQWHLPYVSTEDYTRAGNMGTTYPNYSPLQIVQLLSVARTARVSYKPFNGEDTIEAEMKRANLLVNSGHWSAFSHQATPDYMVSGKWSQKDLHANFYGWCQLRKYFLNENRQHHLSSL